MWQLSPVRVVPLSPLNVSSTSGILENLYLEEILLVILHSCGSVFNTDAKSAYRKDCSEVKTTLLLNSLVNDVSTKMACKTGSV